MRLGFVLASGEEQDLELLGRLGRAAIAAGHDVRLFLMHEAVDWADRPELCALVEAGAEATLCGTSAGARGSRRNEAIRDGSQLDHAALVRDCDRVVTLA